MANAKQCDRCSKFYIPLTPDLIHPHTVRHNYKNSDGKKVYNKLDLCPQCEESLENWCKEGEQK